ncbi:MAG: hypothetical protein U0R78_00610 [Nocardioidaceae bacterium]
MGLTDPRPRVPARTRLETAAKGRNRLITWAVRMYWSVHERQQEPQQVTTRAITSTGASVAITTAATSVGRHCVGLGESDRDEPDHADVGAQRRDRQGDQEERGEAEDDADLVLGEAPGGDGDEREPAEAGDERGHQAAEPAAGEHAQARRGR